MLEKCLYWFPVRFDLWRPAGIQSQVKQPDQFNPPVSLRMQVGVSDRHPLWSEAIRTETSSLVTVLQSTVRLVFWNWLLILHVKKNT